MLMRIVTILALGLNPLSAYGLTASGGFGKRMDQRTYWNSEAGETWAREAARLEAMLEPIGKAGIEALAVKPGEHVLDVGCGAGATSRTLTAAGARVTGIDISAPILALAQAAGGGPSYHLADAGADPLPGPFDALFSRFGVMFFADPVAAFAHMRGAMRPGGRMACVCWRGLLENDWAREPLAAALPYLAPPAQPDPHAPGPFAFADPERTRSILTEAGWREISLEPLTLPYRVGADTEDALSLMLKIGPLGKLLREQPEAAPKAIPALQALIDRHAGPDGVTFTAACWLVRGVA
jgi:SAM-dependent methyltransferase